MQRGYPKRPEWSHLGRRLAKGSGIEDLMEDLGRALADGGDQVLMLGGGNPAHIPAMEEIWGERMREIIADAERLRRTLAIYDPPRGNAKVIEQFATLLREEFGWPIGPENVGITAGGQNAFFMLFNLLAGRMSGGNLKHILFPLVPEYIGYASQGLAEEMLVATRPQIEILGPHRFKYHVDFDALRVGSDTAAICVSRPTNPSGNLMGHAELSRLEALAAQNKIPLIIDNAYGLPFPGIVFRDEKPFWSENTILVLSLSKFGLPGTRTAFVVAHPGIIDALSSMTAITGLANGNFGQAIAGPLIAGGEILRMSREIVRPYYESKRTLALAAAEEFFPDDTPYRLHECEGSLFLWLWLQDSPVRSSELYARLKARGVLVVPGEFFFFGLPEDGWKHRHECVRISFAMSEDTIRRGMKIIGEEIRRCY